MIQPFSFQAMVSVVVCVLATAEFPQHVKAQVEQNSALPTTRVLPISTKNSSSMRGTFVTTAPTSVRWEGNEYDVDSGIEVLMNVITDDRTNRATRAKAINRLGHLSTSLQDRECLPKLYVLYNGLESRREKLEVLRTLIATKDPRGLSLFHRVATTETDPLLRNAAAVGLADWNIREGVQKLIELFPSSAETGLRQVGAAAMISFTSLNERKDWKCPQDAIREAALVLAGDSREEYAKAALQGYRDWFEVNKERFPDWKPGDPLPEVDTVERETDK